MAAITLNFTKKNIEDINLADKGRSTYKDCKDRYLYLFVTPLKKTFYYLRKIDGRNVQVKLDHFPQMTVFLARQRIAEISAQIASGENPKNKKREEKDNTIAFGKLFDIYLEQHLKPHAQTWKEDERRCDVYIPSWKCKKANQINRDDVVNLHNRLKKERGATTANRVVQLIRRVYNYHIKNYSLTLENPAINIKLFDEDTRSRFMNADELKRFFAALENETSEKWRDFFTLSLFVGSRRSNIQEMKWEEIDFTRKVWTIPRVKSIKKKEHIVPLVPQAISILWRRKEQKNEDEEFVFPAKSKYGHITEPKKAWKKILEKADIKNLRIHDLRRTCGSWQAAGGASLQIIGKSLGHDSLEATEIYSRLDLDPVRDSMENAAQSMIEAVTSVEDRKESATKRLLDLVNNIDESQAEKILKLIEKNNLTKDAS